MKTWMLALSLVAVLGFAGMADAKGKGAGGIRGKIVSVGQGTITIMTHAHGNKGAVNAAGGAAGETLTVQYNAGTTVMIDGVAGKITSAHVGKHVSVVGGRNGNTISASSITVRTTGHKKKQAA